MSALALVSGTGPATGNAVSAMDRSINDRNMVKQWVLFDPLSLHRLQPVSRAIRRTCNLLLRENIQRIVTLHSKGNPLWYRQIRLSFALTLNVKIEQLPTLDYTQLPSAAIAQLHSTIPQNIRALGIDANRCPNRILLLEEVAAFSPEVQRTQNNSLMRWWPSMRLQIQKEILEAKLKTTEIPQAWAPVEEIHRWLDSNRSSLGQMIDLDLKWAMGSNERMTYAPLEIGSFTGLTHLHLSDHAITLLPENLLCELPHLRVFQMSGCGDHDKSLTFLPENLFRCNPKLEVVYLPYHHLTTLPENLFRHNPNLNAVTLSYNKLTTLPECLFKNTRLLRLLYLENNEQLSLSQNFLLQIAGLKDFSPYMLANLLRKHSSTAKFMRLRRDAEQNPDLDTLKRLQEEFSRLDISMVMLLVRAECIPRQLIQQAIERFQSLRNNLTVKE